jgi:hypothetical protein
LLTIAYPIAIDQGYLHYNKWALPVLGLVAAILYLTFFFTTATFGSFRKNYPRLAITAIGAAAVLLAIGAGIGYTKSSQHVDELRKKDATATVISATKEQVKPTETERPPSTAPAPQRTIDTQAKRPAIAPKPDVSVILVHPKAPGVWVNPPNILANKVVVIPFLWDLDLPDRNTSLTIHRVDYDWIRPDQHAGPTALIPAEDGNVVKAGHRIFGFISVTCPECAKTRDYFVCFTNGDGAGDQTVGSPEVNVLVGWVRIRSAPTRRASKAAGRSASEP